MYHREQEVKELVSFSINTEVHHLDALMICKNIAKYIADGKYTAAQGQDIWGRFADKVSRAYTEQYGTPGRNLFTTEDRQYVASKLAEHYEPEINEILAGASVQEFVLVKIYDYSRDVNGNPTARHAAVASNDQGTVDPNAFTVKPQRRQTGTGDYLDGVDTALEKGGFKPAAYEQVRVSGSRSDGITTVLLKHRPLQIPG